VALAAALTFLALRGLFTAFVCLNLLALVVAPVNLLLGANSMYLSAPLGGTTSPFFFAPWSWFLLFLEFLGLLMFFLAYLPFRRPSSLREASAGPICFALGGGPIRDRTICRCGRGIPGA